MGTPSTVQSEVQGLTWSPGFHDLSSDDSHQQTPELDGFALLGVEFDVRSFRADLKESLIPKHKDRHRRGVRVTR